MVTDHLLRIPLHRLAEARPGTSYVYEFAWPSNLPDLGACHALELGFVFDTGDAPESAKLAGEGAPTELADAMHGAWVRSPPTATPAGSPGTPPTRSRSSARATLYRVRPSGRRFRGVDGRHTTTPETAPVAEPAEGWPARTAELRSVVRRLRRSGWPGAH